MTDQAYFAYLMRLGTARTAQEMTQIDADLSREHAGPDRDALRRVWMQQAAAFKLHPGGRE